MKYAAIFENSDGSKGVSRVFDCPSLEDATIEATTYAEENGLTLCVIEEEVF